MGSEERCGSTLMVEWGVHPGPLVPARYGMRYVFDLQVAQKLRLYMAPVNEDFGLVAVAGEHLAFRNQCSDLVCLAGHELQCPVIYYLHGKILSRTKKAR
jgi:hypothetical protein